MRPWRGTSSWEQAPWGLSPVCSAGSDASLGAGGCGLEGAGNGDGTLQQVPTGLRRQGWLCPCPEPQELQGQLGRVRLEQLREAGGPDLPEAGQEGDAPPLAREERIEHLLDLLLVAQFPLVVLTRTRMVDDPKFEDFGNE